MTCITVGAGKEFTIAEEGAELTLSIVHVYNRTKDKEGCPPEGLRVHYGSTCKQDETVNVLVKEANTGNLMLVVYFAVMQCVCGAGANMCCCYSQVQTYAIAISAGVWRTCRHTPRHTK